MNIDDFNPIILNVGKAVCNANWNWPNVCSPFARIYYVVAGNAYVQIGDVNLQLKQRRMYFLPPFTTHTTKCDSYFVHYYIHIYENGLNGTGILEKYDIPYEIEAEKDDNVLFERLVLLNPSMSLKRYDPKDYDNNETLLESIAHNRLRSEWLVMESRGIIFQLCSRFMRNAVPKPFIANDHIYKAMHFIHENLDRYITVEQLASISGLSVEHMIRLFNKCMGISPLQYINQKRIEKAQLQLLTTNMTVKEISMSLGFVDNSYFTRVFKRVAGKTPNEYRKIINTTTK